MTVHIVQSKWPDGAERPAYLLDSEVADLLEGFCPFRDASHPSDDGRLEITPDGWALCSIGMRWRVVADDMGK
jgi:hypothetical protein